MQESSIELITKILSGGAQPTLKDYILGSRLGKKVLRLFCGKFLTISKKSPHQMYEFIGKSITIEKQANLFNTYPNKELLLEISNYIINDATELSTTSLNFIENNILIINDSVPHYVFKKLIQKLPISSIAKMMGQINQLIMEGRNDLIDSIDNSILKNEFISLNDQNLLLEWKIAYSQDHINAEKVLKIKHAEIAESRSDETAINFQPRIKKIRLGIFGRKISPNFISSATTYINWIKQLKNYDIETIVFSDGNPDYVDDNFMNEFTEWHQINDVTDEKLLNLIKLCDINLILKIDSNRKIIHSKIINIPIIDNGSLVDITGGATHIICNSNQLNTKYSYYYTKNKIVTNRYWSYTINRPENIQITHNKTEDFCIFNRASKLSDITYQTIALLLNSNPESNLAFKFIQAQPYNHIHTYIIEKLSLYGISPDRLLIIPRTFGTQQLQLYNSFKYCIDTFPQTGGLSTFESLWMNKTSILYLHDDRPWSLASKFIYDWLNIDYATSNSPEDYVKKTNLHLNAKQINTREKLMQSKLFDHDGFAENFSQCCKQILDKSKISPNDFRITK